MASNGWQEIPLGCLGSLRKGVDFGYDQEGNGTPVVKVKDFGDRLFVSHCDLDKLNDSQIAIPKSQLLQKDDIVIIRSNGNSERLGLSMMYRGSAHATTFSGCCIRFRPDTKQIDPLFATYFLRSPTCRQRLSAFGCGTGIHNLSQHILSELSVPLPPLDQQKAIAHILSTLDNKIELNRRMNETLEAIVSAIFKSWFVDFDPVRAKLKGRNISLPKSISDLFPDGLVESELGQIPEGWQVQPIREIIDAVFDGPHATPPESAEGPVFLRITNLTGTQLDLTNVRHIGEEDWSRWTERVTPQCGDIVFSYEAVLGSFALIPPDLRCCLGRRLALIRPRKSDPFRYFLFHSFVSAPFRRRLIGRSTHGSTVNRVPLRAFPDYLLVWPPARVRSAFDDIAESFWATIHRNQKEDRTLAAIRDTLSPKLLSGDLQATSVHPLPSKSLHRSNVTIITEGPTECLALPELLLRLEQESPRFAGVSKWLPDVRFVDGTGRIIDCVCKLATTPETKSVVFVDGDKSRQVGLADNHPDVPVIHLPNGVEFEQIVSELVYFAAVAECHNIPPEELTVQRFETWKKNSAIPNLDRWAFTKQVDSWLMEEHGCSLERPRIMLQAVKSVELDTVQYQDVLADLHIEVSRLLNMSAG